MTMLHVLMISTALLAQEPQLARTTLRPPRVVAESVSVPNLIDSTLVAAALALGRLRLATGEIVYVERAGPPGLVVSHQPPSGTLVSPRTPVTLRLSTQIRFVRVPSVVDSSLARARVILREAGFRVGRIDSLPDPRRPGIVVRQIPFGNDSVSPRVAVDLWVARRVSVAEADPDAPVVIPQPAPETVVTTAPERTDTGESTVVQGGPRRWWIPTGIVGGGIVLLVLLAKLGLFARPKADGPSPPAPPHTPPTPPPAGPPLELKPHRDSGTATVDRGDLGASDGVRLRAVVDRGTPTIDPDQRITEEEAP
jgi:hypothetical protein